MWLRFALQGGGKRHKAVYKSHGQRAVYQSPFEWGKPRQKQPQKQPQKLLYLLRGPPGAGKSHYALTRIHKALGQKPTEQVVRQHVLSTDDYFLTQGKYVFNPDHLTKNHLRNQQKTQEQMARGVTPLFIDNTNIEPAHMEPYVRLAEDNQYEIRITNMHNYASRLNPVWKGGKINRSLLHKRAQQRRQSGSGKDIPDAVIDQICDRYEEIPTLTLEDLHQAFEAEAAAAQVGDLIQSMEGTQWGTIVNAATLELDSGRSIRAENAGRTWQVARSAAPAAPPPDPFSYGKDLYVDGNVKWTGGPLIARSPKMLALLEKEGDTRPEKVYKPFTMGAFVDDLYCHPKDDPGCSNVPIYGYDHFQPVYLDGKYVFSGWDNYG